MYVVIRYKSQVEILVAINKKLIEDICNQVNNSTVAISADATNFYDRAHDPFSSLT